MTNSAKFIARFDLSGPEEFCNLIAANDAALRYRVEAVRELLDGANAIRWSADEYHEHTIVALLCDLIVELNVAATEAMYRIELDGFMFRNSETPAELDLSYDFLLGSTIVNSRYNQHMSALERLSEQIQKASQSLLLEIGLHNPIVDGPGPDDSFL